MIDNKSGPYFILNNLNIIAYFSFFSVWTKVWTVLFYIGLMNKFKKSRIYFQDLILIKEGSCTQTRNFITHGLKKMQSK